MLHVSRESRTILRQAVTWPDLPQVHAQIQIESWILTVAAVRWILAPLTLRAQVVQIHVVITREGEGELRDLFVDGAEVLPS